VEDLESIADCEAYLMNRKQRVHEQMQKVGELIRKHELPEARLEGNRLVVSPLGRLGPDMAEQWAERVYAFLPRVQTNAPASGSRRLDQLHGCLRTSTRASRSPTRLAC